MKKSRRYEGGEEDNENTRKNIMKRAEAENKERIEGKENIMKRRRG